MMAIFYFIMMFYFVEMSVKFVDLDLKEGSYFSEPEIKIDTLFLLCLLLTMYIASFAGFMEVLYGR